MQRGDIESIRDFSVTRMRNPKRVLNHLDLVRDKRVEIQQPKIGLLEFHPCNKCSISCFYCTYRRSGSEVFPFLQLDKLSVLSPRAIVITGGGEVTEYVSGNYTFNDLILRIREIFPGAALGVTTNGQQVPGGDWQRYVSWLRVSIDAADSRTFLVMKGASLEKTLNNLCEYINGPIARIGAGFVFNRFNISEASDFLNKVINHVLLHCGPEGVHKLNFQYRPTCLIESCRCPSSNYLDRGLMMVPDKQSWWNECLSDQKKRIYSTIKGQHWYSRFLEHRTNLNSVTLFDYNNTVPVFRNCYLSLIRAVLRPNGDVYPCVMRASNFSQPIANLFSDNDAAGDLISGQKKYFSMNPAYCGSYKECCRIDGHKNTIIEEALDSQARAGKGQEPIDWFF
jgi:MoaA/NifB/PqqE/SkfB family radical SAM enzyme